MDTKIKRGVAIIRKLVEDRSVYNLAQLNDALLRR